VFGGLNRLWGSEEDQQRFVRMWVALARRYRSGRYLLAYELMNEPTPPKDYSLGEYRRLCLRLVDAIRAEDPGRFVVISPLDWSSVWGLKDSLLLPRPNLIYTFHFYSPYSVTYGGAKYPGKVTVSTRWIGNSPEGWGAQGNTDWHLLERTCRAPEGATHGVIMLRSDRNAGETWFDDVTLACDGQPTGFPANAGFDAEVRSAGWKVERQTAGEFTWNAAEGHAAPGSLRISGTDSYNAWVTTDRLAVRAGAEYRVGCWVKTRGATGWSYPCVAWFQDVEEVVDKAWIERQLKPAMGFSRRYRVPVWCGEFGCSQSNPDGSGFRWVRDVGMVLNRLGIAWTYWNWRESTNPGSMGVWVQVEGEYRQQESLSKLLRLLWRHGHGAG
jgi:endoglucanase